MDQLEKFTRAHRADFDQAVPSLKVWAGIDQAIPEKSARPSLRWYSLRIAAAVAILLTIGGLAGSYLTRAQQYNSTVAILQETTPEYFETEQYFQGQIDQRIQQLTSYHPDTQVLEDLEQLDQAMRELKQELRKAPEGQEELIVEQLIRNYQTKIAILERVLDKINTSPASNTSKKEQNEISL